jgi:hypothetical protein
MQEAFCPTNFRCPICEAQTQQECVLTTVAPRFESHIARKWIAACIDYGRFATETIPFSGVPQDGHGRPGKQMPRVADRLSSR